MKQFKTSFLLHDDSLEILDELSDEEAGRLFKAIAKTHKAIVSEKTESVNSDNFGLNRLEWVLFKPFYNQLCRDYDSYKDTVETNRQNGKKGGRPRKEEPKKPNRFLENPKNHDKEKDSDKEKEYKEHAKKVIDSINIKAKKSFRHTDNNISKITPRLKEGFSLEDCLYVVNIKSAEWVNSDMEKHLNPETLFRPSNFEKYLNQKDINKPANIYESFLTDSRYAD